MNFRELQYVLPYEVSIDLVDVITKYNINTPSRLRHFISQCMHESANFTATRENLNYSAHSLLKVFPKYFDKYTANDYARKPPLIASRVYANRMGNGDEASADGWLYRGRGYIQITGKNNYTAYNAFTEDNVIDSPGLVSTKYALDSAGWFWKTNGLNDLAVDDDMSTVVKVSKKINLGNQNSQGKVNGLDDRVECFNKVKGLITL